MMLGKRSSDASSNCTENKDLELFDLCNKCKVLPMSVFCTTCSKPNGKGIFTYGNGDRSEGDYVDGKRQGIHKYTYRDGSVEEVTYVDGEIVTKLASTV